MEGDFTRNSDDREASYSGVLMQQGRVQLDADWNEQWVIQTEALRSALRDLIGRHGGPANELGFGIALKGDQLDIGPGVYYVDGIRCHQRRGDILSMAKRDGGDYLVFLDVWERHVNAIEDPRIREVALLGPDTATRAEVAWRVRLLSYKVGLGEDPPGTIEKLVEDELRSRPRRRLAARAQTTNANTDPCVLSPAARYRGENQLYRVQIHDAWPEDSRNRDSNDPLLFTFKWSRDNGSVVFPIVHVAAPEAPAAAGDQKIVVTVTVGHLGREERYGLVANDIVELVHDAVTRETRESDGGALVQDERDPGRPGLLGRVLAPIDPDDLTVRIEVYADDLTEIAEGTLHPYLRRWDQRDTAQRKLHLGAIPVRRSDLGKWLPIEGGVEVMFGDASDGGDGDPQRQKKRPTEQRAGEYWMIPARTATGDVLWPTAETGEPSGRTAQLVPPHGPQHHYAPLAIFKWDNRTVVSLQGVRRQFGPLAIPEPPPVALRG